jgi:hypothetical protein
MLATLLKNMTEEDAKVLLAKETKQKPKPIMLLSTVNCSIGNKKKHFTLTGLKRLFYKQDDLNVYDRYALKTIKHEALKEEVNDFIAYYRISPKRVAKVLSDV